MSETRDHPHPYYAGDEAPTDFDDALREAQRIIPVDQEPLDSPSARRAARLILAGALYGFQQKYSRLPGDVEIVRIEAGMHRDKLLHATSIGTKIARQYFPGISFLEAREDHPRSGDGLGGPSGSSPHSSRGIATAREDPLHAFFGIHATSSQMLISSSRSQLPAERQQYEQPDSNHS